MAYKVMQWATGHVGVHALRGIAQHPDMELVGLWVSSDAKAGRDAGELCGLGRTGVTATRDADALIATPADCVSYMAATDYRPGDAIEDMCRILASGKNVVSSSVVGLVHPRALPERITAQLEEACRAGRSSFFTSGIDPGFANDVLPLVLSGLCERWEEIRVQEIINAVTLSHREHRWVELPLSPGHGSLGDRSPF